jgi:hypothetical protein
MHRITSALASYLAIFLKAPHHITLGCILGNIFQCTASHQPSSHKEYSQGILGKVDELSDI